MDGNIPISLMVGEQSFAFSLCRKQQRFDDIAVDHWWMRTTALYAQRARRHHASGNLTAVTSAFWALCQRDGCHTDPENQETFLLSQLVPFVRNQGSRHIFADACLDPPRQRTRSRGEIGEELEEILQVERSRKADRLHFQRNTGNVLGPPALDAATVDTYRAFCKELLAPGMEVVLNHPVEAVDGVIKRWKGLMTAIGRRAGKQSEKRVLDVISYEARASLHNCYSDVWDMLLLPYLETEYQLSPASREFLRLWHLDHAEESNLGDQARFHLFHGHIYALHPIGSMLLDTSTGQFLMGQWLRNPTDAHRQQILHALCVTAHYYANRRENAADKRRRQPASTCRLRVKDVDDCTTRSRRSTRFKPREED